MGETAAYGLVADPDPERGAIYRNVLLAEGLDAVVTGDGAEALSAVAARGAPIIVVADLALPVVDGFSLLRQLRGTLAPEAAPAVVVSSYGAMRAVAWQMREELGISALLSKASGPEAVARAIRRSLAGFRSTEPEDEEARTAEAERERSRLARIAAMRLVDDLPPDEALQKFVADLGRAFDAPIALISIILQDRQWLKAYYGLEGTDVAASRGAPREITFCTHVVEADRNEPLVIPDATKHPVLSSNPFVTGGVVRSYAAAPLVTASGHVLGTLCIYDSKPLTLGMEEVQVLIALARRIAGEIELLAVERSSSEPMRMLLEPKDEQKAVFAAIGYLEMMMANLEAGVVLMDSKRRVNYVNRFLCDMIGVSEERMVGMSRDEFIDLWAPYFADQASFRRKVHVLPDGPYSAQEVLEMNRPRRRILRWVAKPVHLGTTVGQLGILTDITAEVDLAAERERKALIDPVTHLPIRRAGEDSIAREVARARRNKTPLSFAFIDIDHFKAVNDRHGHATGDQVLRQVAAVLSSVCRGSDLAVRWGGEEFLLVLPDTGGEGAKSLAERARRRIEEVSIDGVQVTISAGVAELQPGEDAATAIARADRRLFHAKSEGRNRVV